MSNKIFGIKVLLNDFASPVTANGDIGLYQVAATCAAAITAGLSEATVTSVIDLEKNRIVQVRGGSAGDINYIKAIQGNKVLFHNPWTTSFTLGGLPRLVSNSEFRWTQNAVTGSAQSWKSGMIVKNGLDAFDRVIDLSNGSNIAANGQSCVKVKNTQQFFNTLKSWSIYLNGLDADIYRFDGPVPSRKWSGICEEPSWNSTEYKIPLYGKLNKRRANLTKFINKNDYPHASDDDVGKALPVAFGRLEKTRFQRVESSEVVFAFANVNILSLDTAAPADKIELMISGSAVGRTAFPIIGNDGTTPPRMYKIKISNTTSGISYRKGGIFWEPYSESLPIFAGKYLHVIDGTSQGKYRYIESVAVNSVSGLIWEITVSDYFEDTLAGNSSATATNPDNSWVEFVNIHREYQCDSWPCRSILDSNGNEVTSGFDLYSYSDNKKTRTTITEDDLGKEKISPVEESSFAFRAVPDFAYASTTENKDNNRLAIDLKLSANLCAKPDSNQAPLWHGYAQ